MTLGLSHVKPPLIAPLKRVATKKAKMPNWGHAVRAREEEVQQHGKEQKVDCSIRCGFRKTRQGDLILVAFITGNSSLEPLIEGLYAQIHVNLR